MPARPFAQLPKTRSDRRIVVSRKKEIVRFLGSRGPILVLLLASHDVRDSSQSVPLDGIDGSANIDGDDVFLVLLGKLEDAELAGHHVGAHVVVLSCLYAFPEHVLGGVEEDEVDEQRMVVVSRNSDDVPVLALQCRARQDDAVGAGRESLTRLFAEDRQPVPAIGIGKWDAVGHFVDIRLGVILLTEKIRC